MLRNIKNKLVLTRKVKNGKIMLSWVEKSTLIRIRNGKETHFLNEEKGEEMERTIRYQRGNSGEICWPKDKEMAKKLAEEMAAEIGKFEKLYKKENGESCSCLGLNHDLGLHLAEMYIKDEKSKELVEATGYYDFCEQLKESIKNMMNSWYNIKCVSFPRKLTFVIKGLFLIFSSIIGKAITFYKFFTNILQKMKKIVYNREK